MPKPSEMTLAAVVAKRRQLEEDIRALLDNFSDETGLTPCGINVERLVTQFIDSPEQHAVVAGVRVLIEL